MKISVIPFCNDDLNNVFFDENKLYNFPYYINKYFKEQKDVINTVDITSIEESDCIIFFELNLKYIFQAYLANKLHKSIYIPFEPPVIDLLHKPENLRLLSKLFGKILTWQDNLIDNEDFFKFYFPMPSQNFEYKKIDFINKKYLTTIVGYKQSNQLNELYSKRVEAIKYFENKYTDFEFFGTAWNTEEFKSYKGKVNSKYEALQNYKFTVCYENECNINGLISEKIFDCFYSRSIPIYWGSSNICEYFPKETYIDKREFNSYEELDDFLSKITEEEYEKKINAIEEYLKSKEFENFSSENFAIKIYEQMDTKKQKKQNIIYFGWLIFKKIKINFSKFIKRFR